MVKKSNNSEEQRNQVKIKLREWKNLTMNEKAEIDKHLDQLEKSLQEAELTTPKEKNICSYCKIELEKDALYCKLCGRAIKKSRHIPVIVRREVWRRDNGQCVECGSKERLEYDHIIPFSKGGSNTAKNIQLLCEVWNRNKSNEI